MKSEMRVLGIDGGGTGSRSFLCDGGGHELYREVGGAALVRPGFEHESVHALSELVSRTLEGAGVSGIPDVLVAGLAGVGREQSRIEMAGRLSELEWARSVCVVTDVDAAFQDAFGDGPGLLLIAGTGSAARARLPSGGVVRTGGWGALVGDEGSGWSLGIAGLRAALRGRDGRGPPTRLTATLPASLGYPESTSLVHHLWGLSKAEIAALAPLVVAAADQGDREAARIVDEAVDRLVEHVVALRREWTDGVSPPVALLGGLIVPGGPLRSRLTERLHELEVSPREAPPDGARGAAMLGLQDPPAGGRGCRPAAG